MAELNRISAAPLQREASEPNLAEGAQECNKPLKDEEEGGGGIQADRVQGGPTSMSGGLFVHKIVVFSPVGLLVLIALLMGIPALLGDRLCLESQGVRNCQHELRLGLTKPGPPGEQCKVLATLSGQDQPCCYKEQASGLNHHVCSFEQQNVLMTNVCRNRSRYPVVKMVGNNCTITLKDLNEQDAGCYDFYMPHNSKEPLYHKCVDSDDICPSTIKTHCVPTWLVQLVCCVILMAAAIFLVLVLKKKFALG